MERLNKVDKAWQLPFFGIWTGQQLSLIGSREESDPIIDPAPAAVEVGE